MVTSERDLGEKDLLRIRGVVLEILEQKLSSMPLTPMQMPKECQEEMAAMVTKTLAQREEEVGVQLLLVKNTHPASLIVNVARNSDRACCGWEFAKPPWHEFVPSGVSKDRKCSACRNAI